MTQPPWKDRGRW